MRENFQLVFWRQHRSCLDGLMKYIPLKYQGIATCTRDNIHRNRGACLFFYFVDGVLKNVEWNPELYPASEGMEVIDYSSFDMPEPLPRFLELLKSQARPMFSNPYASAPLPLP